MHPIHNTLMPLIFVSVTAVEFTIMMFWNICLVFLLPIKLISVTVIAIMHIIQRGKIR